MQQSINPKVLPSYLERMTLYFCPTGELILTMGNQRIVATAEEIERFLKSRLTQHVQSTALLIQEQN